MHKYNVGDRVRHIHKGFGTIVERCEYDSELYDVKYDNFVGRNSDELHMWFSVEKNLTLMENDNMNIGTFVKHNEFGSGTVVETEVGTCGQYTRVKFNSCIHRVKPCELTIVEFNIGDRVYAECTHVSGEGTIVTTDDSGMPYRVHFDEADIELWCYKHDVSKLETRSLTVGDRVYAKDKYYEGSGTIEKSDGSTLPYFVRFDNGSRWWFDVNEVTKLENKPRFDTGDIVRSNSIYGGKSFVGTVVSYCEGTSIVNIGCDVSIQNTSMDKVEPEFNIGDKITKSDGSTVHMVTNVRPNGDNNCVCYDTTWGECDIIGYVYDKSAKAHVELKSEHQLIRERLQEELEILKDASHSRDCGSLDCNDCPFHLKSKGCASIAIRCILNELKE